jgi:nucleoside-diphosphate-sugar epimerase
MICFTRDSAATLVQAIRGRCEHLIHCGSIGGTGRASSSRCGRTTPRRRSASTDRQGRDRQVPGRRDTGGGLPTTVLQPGHISGPGWTPIGPLGNLDPGVWRALSAGQEVAVPGLGAELMHHVHADDVAQASSSPSSTARRQRGSRSTWSTAPSALTARGFLEIAARWFGQTAQTRSVSWAEFRSGTSEEFADSSWEHLSRSQYASIEKARILLGYAPAYEPRPRSSKGSAGSSPRSARGRQSLGRLAAVARGRRPGGLPCRRGVVTVRPLQ